MPVFSKLELLYSVQGQKTITATIAGESGNVIPAVIDSENPDFLRVLAELFNSILMLDGFGEMFEVFVSNDGALIPNPMGQAVQWKYPTFRPSVSQDVYDLKDGEPPAAVIDSNGVRQLPALLSAGSTPTIGIRVVYVPHSFTFRITAAILDVRQSWDDLTTNNNTYWDFYPQVFNKILAHYSYQQLGQFWPQINLQVEPGTSIISWMDPKSSMALSTVSVSSVQVVVGTTALVTLQAKDAFGDNITTGGLTVAFGLGTGSGKGTYSEVADMQNGTYTATFTGTTAGSNTIMATINGQRVISTSPTITVR